MRRLCPHGIFNLKMEVEKAKAELEKQIVYVNLISYIFSLNTSKKVSAFTKESREESRMCSWWPFSGHIWW